MEFPVMMTDNKGNQWIEDSYSGYGIFGGKDFYVLLAEMNGQEGSKEELRGKGINLYFSNDSSVLHPNLSQDMEWTWRDEKVSDCPDQGFFI